ncbi:MAG: hypothetical protein Q7R70_07105, partial [Candidatus Diapherotrites archaeon]|nr:hypothetical protein [Candidatus Diapherotrites archaeon]
RVPSFARLPGFKQRSGGRIAFKSSGRLRVFKQSSLRVARGSWKGKSAVFVSSLKTGKRITWKLT